MKKRLFSILLCGFLVLGLTTGCGNDESNNNTNNSNNINNSNNQQTNNNETNKNITLNDVLSHKTSPDSDFFVNDDGNGGLVLMEYLGHEEIVVLPETINGKPITEINKYVFSNNSSVKAIKLSNSVKKIDWGAFTQNHNLQIFVSGSSLELIDDSAFQDCESLHTVKLNDGLKEIGTLAFSQCDSLESLLIPNSVETIEIIAFNLMNDNFTIKGKSGSVAESYAKSENFKFVVE